MIEPIKLDTTSVSVEKHVDLSRAIEEISSIYMRLNDIANRINGVDVSSASNQDTRDVPDSPKPSLRLVLDDGAGSIREEISATHEVISEIELALF